MHRALLVVLRVCIGDDQVQEDAHEEDVELEGVVRGAQVAGVVPDKHLFQ